MRTFTMASVEQTQRVHRLAVEVLARPREHLMTIALAAKFGTPRVLDALKAEQARAKGAWGNFGKLQDRLSGSLSDSRPTAGPKARPPSRNRRRGW